jgi:hypothetical protein
VCRNLKFGGFEISFDFIIIFLTALDQNQCNKSINKADLLDKLDYELKIRCLPNNTSKRKTSITNSSKQALLSDPPGGPLVLKWQELPQNLSWHLLGIEEMPGEYISGWIFKVGLNYMSLAYK